MPSRLLPAVAVAATMTLFAAPAIAAGNVASVDYQRLVKEAPQAKASDNLLKNQLSPRKKAIEQQQKKVKSLHESYAAMGPETNPLERASATQNLENAQKKLGKLRSQYSSTLTLHRHELRANFRAVVNQDIETYAKGHGYTVVVDDGVIYSGSATDITDEILAMLKAQYRKVRSSTNKGKKPR
ncbi:MAG: OmpH family outer membrane protein [Gammaproteobacteria bacterium]